MKLLFQFLVITVLLSACSTATVPSVIPPTITSTPILQGTETPHPTEPPTVTAADIFGNVMDSEGFLIEGINLAIRQGDERVDVDSAADGSFSTDLPPSTNPVWNVQVVGIDCTSRVMHNCMLTGYFESVQELNVTLPLAEPITFIFEKATTTIKGEVSTSGLGIFAIRSDGARTWGESLNDRTFELPASDGLWEVYATDLDSDQEGEHISLEIINGKSNFVHLTSP